MRWMEQFRKMMDKNKGYVNWEEFEGLKHNYKVASSLIVEEI